MANRDEASDRVRAFAERVLGATVVACERQPRWRPAWFLTAVRDGERLELYFRGDRGISQGGAYPLEHELRCLELLAAGGIPVPRVYGFCHEPRGILMERVPGRSDLSTAIDDAERYAVQDDYVAILARIHALDTAPFEAAGFHRPASGRETALSDLPIWERGFRKAKARPEPLLEFGLRWLHRNAPQGSGRISFVCADAGQFVFANGRVTAVLDLELAHLGDPAEDIAGLRTRDLSEPLGDLRRAAATYEKATGAPLDRALVDYHTVRFALVTPLAIAGLVAAPPKGTDLIQYLCWYHVYGRTPLEVIARRQGIALDPPALPEAVSALPPAWSALPPASSALPEGASALPAASSALPARDDVATTGAGDFGAYAEDAAARRAEYARRVERFGPALEADDLADAATLIGRAPRDARDAAEAIEAVVVEAGPERDAELLRLLHRRALRQECLLAPVLRELAGASIQDLG